MHDFRKYQIALKGIAGYILTVLRNTQLSFVCDYQRDLRETLGFIF